MSQITQPLVLSATDLLSALADAGFRHLAGVPCSCLAAVHEELGRDARFVYVPTPNEGSALAMAVGFQLAGNEAALLIQNSGFGNLLDPLTSLAMISRVPVLTIMSMRGWAAGDDAEPQHEVMGRGTVPMLDALGLPHHVLPATADRLRAVFAAARRTLAAGQPTFLLVPPDAIASCATPPAATGAAFGRGPAVRALVDLFPGALFISTTGFISRELYAHSDRPENFYLEGAMGHAASVAAGVALSSPDRRVVVVDGDGSALMHLGVLSLIGHLGLPNLVHVILDNGRYESTGGQATTAAGTAFATVATGCGYRAALTVSSEKELRDARAALSGAGPTLVHVRITPHSPAPGPRVAATIRPPEVARRFADAVRG
jgi:phosphonopyruvate decarboxylase